MLNGKKCGVPYSIGYGILTKNPENVTERDIENYRPLLYIKYEEYWYIVKKEFSNINELHSYLTKDVYCKEQFIEKILSVL